MIWTKRERSSTCEMVKWIHHKPSAIRRGTSHEQDNTGSKEKARRSKAGQQEREKLCEQGIWGELVKREAVVQTIWQKLAVIGRKVASAAKPPRKHDRRYPELLRPGEKVQTTMDTYSHLYPNKQVEVARQLDGIMPWASGYKNRCKCSQFVASKKEKSWKALYCQRFSGFRKHLIFIPTRQIQVYEEVFLLNLQVKYSQIC